MLFLQWLTYLFIGTFAFGVSMASFVYLCLLIFEDFIRSKKHKAKTNIRSMGVMLVGFVCNILTSLWFILVVMFGD